MIEKMSVLLSEYEQLTGRSPTWREDMSINDFLQLRDYAKKSSLGQIETSHFNVQPVTNVIKKEFKQTDSENKNKESTNNNTIPFSTQKKNEPKQSAVDILKAIMD